ncbi:MAG TPA: ABC transporter substrate-binding protein [Stellaceae bacterium]|nr:ABC transporter substrate-binding protein [Stellaceae bacterium]
MAFSRWRIPVARSAGRHWAPPLTRRLMLGVLLTIGAAGPGLAAAPSSSPAAVAFMNRLWSSALVVLNKQTPIAERRARFRELFRNDFDCPGIARFVLGRYWRTASPEEQKEFLKLFEDYVVFVYTARLSDFNGEQFKVSGSRPDQDAVIVSTDVITPGAPQPLKVDWRLINDDGQFKISDVIVEGVSMAVTQRSEFASVIQRHGGQVQGLLDLMREKTASAAR